MEPFKLLIHDELAFDLGKRVRDVWPDFPTRRYRGLVRGALEPLELKDRARKVGASLWECLPGPAAENFRVLTQAAQTIPVIGVDELQTGWSIFPLDMILGEHGPEAFEPALDFAHAITQRFTAEFGIRSLLIADFDRALPTLRRWATDSSLHVRRLVSEGTRPRLPWGQQLKALVTDPSPTRELLETLRDDPEEYVRRSVANHWNDIAKDHPDVVVDAMGAWAKNANPQRKRLIRHASRSLIKAGHPGALRVLGFAPAELSSAALKLTPKRFELGGRLTGGVKLVSNAARAQPLVVDFRFHLVKANGGTAPKVFKGKTIDLPANGVLEWDHRFSLKPVTTRRYYPGPTQVEVLVNGQVAAVSEFQMVIPEANA